ncbi:hypothetical protein [Brevibacillus sp. NRS-1366]|uniref:hypothetical protein n=1 Tax=Brevibacillus sp. NRS-1366 TaxID=3233899 RepID=UPI003D260CEB
MKKTDTEPSALFVMPNVFKSAIGAGGSLFSTYPFLFLKGFIRAYIVRETFIGTRRSINGKKAFTTGNFTVTKIHSLETYPKLSVFTLKQKGETSAVRANSFMLESKFFTASFDSFSLWL